MSKEEVSDKLSGVSINVDPKLKIIFHTDVVVHIDEQKAEIKSDPEAVQSQKPEPIDLKKDLKESIDQMVGLHNALVQSTKILNNRCRCSEADKQILYQSKMDRSHGDVVYRSLVPDDKVFWNIDYPDYNPNDFTDKKILAQPSYADQPDPSLITKWNDLDGEIDRRSHMGTYKIVNGVPQNPCGRTGITGRGQLGKWGVNHAADPIVTRWKRDSKGNKETKATFDKDGNETYKQVLQFVSIRRLDTDEWAIPGGMCDPGEHVSVTLKREFMEEATDCLGENSASREETEKHLDKLFSGGHEIYKGYVDDPRNTDNAWMETIAYNFHDENDESLGHFKLTAGDDAGAVTWMTIDKDMKLYASHRHFIELTVEHLKAHW